MICFRDRTYCSARRCTNLGCSRNGRHLDPGGAEYRALWLWAEQLGCSPESAPVALCDMSPECPLYQPEPPASDGEFPA